jgi:hypothetical protein
MPDNQPIRGANGDLVYPRKLKNNMGVTQSNPPPESETAIRRNILGQANKQDQAHHDRKRRQIQKTHEAKIALDAQNFLEVHAAQTTAEAYNQILDQAVYTAPPDSSEGEFAEQLTNDAGRRMRQRNHRIIESHGDIMMNILEENK